MNTLINDLFKKKDVIGIEELIMKVGNYAWREMTLSEQYDLKEKAASELLRLQAIEKAAQAFMDAHDSDWWQECGDWPDDEQYDDSFQIGRLRRIDEALKGLS